MIAVIPTATVALKQWWQSVVAVCGKKVIDEGFEHYSIWQKNQERAIYDEWAIGFKNKVELALKQWSHKAGYEARKLLRTLKLKADQWWYFLLHPEIPPDNNLPER